MATETSVNFPKYGRLGRLEVGLLRRSKLERHKFLEVEETNAILAAIIAAGRETEERDYALIYLSARMGLRVSEVVRFNVEQTLAPLEKFGVIMLVISKRKVGDDRVEYPVQPQVKKFLLDYAKTLRKAEPLTYLFPSETAKTGHITTRTAERIFDLYARMAGVAREKSFHSLRHGLGVLIQRQTKDINVTKKFLRHKSTKTTEIYVHFTDDEMRDVLKDLPEIG